MPAPDKPAPGKEAPGEAPGSRWWPVALGAAATVAVIALWALSARGPAGGSHSGSGSPDSPG